MTLSKNKQKQEKVPDVDVESLPVAGDTMHIGDLVTDPRQIRRHTSRNIGMIGDGLQAVGAARSIVINENNEILAGNGTIEAAAERGFTKVRVIETDGTEIIAVRRSGLTEKQQVELAMYDNRSADFAEYDTAALKEHTELQGVDIDKFFTASELRALSDRDLVKELGSEKADKQKDHVPSTPEGFVAFSIVLSEEDHVFLKAAIEQVKEDQSHIKTSADALIHLVRIATD